MLRLELGLTRIMEKKRVLQGCKSLISCRCQLRERVNRGVWVAGQDSFAQAGMWTLQFAKNYCALLCVPNSMPQGEIGWATEIWSHWFQGDDCEPNSWFKKRDESDHTSNAPDERLLKFKRWEGGTEYWQLADGKMSEVWKGKGRH